MWANPAWATVMKVYCFIANSRKAADTGTNKST